MAKDQQNSTANEKAEAMINGWASAKDAEFVSPEAEKAYKERASRIIDAIQFRIPDRVPFWFQDHCYFPCTYTGISFKEALYNGEKWYESNKKVFLDFEPDMIFNPGNSIHASGQSLEALDTKTQKWPGHGVPDNAGHQYVEGEYMKEDEYGEFIRDNSDFILRKFLPRTHGELEVFSSLPPLNVLGSGLPNSAQFLLQPELMKAFKSIYKAGLEAQKWNALSISFMNDMKNTGFPILIGGGCVCAFDMMSDWYRGMRGSMLDMYRQPDRLLEAIEKVLPQTLAMASAGPKETGNPGVFIALHRGSDGFMSLPQFEEFYWPCLKKLILYLIDEGLIPCIFFEGNHTTRLEYYAELPKGKTLGLFDSSDIYKVKDILGDTMCISGMMPVSLLQVGTPEKVKKYAKELIDVMGKDGGFIMGPRSVLDKADPELVEVWAEFTKEYGVYK